VHHPFAEKHGCVFSHLACDDTTVTAPDDAAITHGEVRGVISRNASLTDESENRRKTTYRRPYAYGHSVALPQGEEDMRRLMNDAEYQQFINTGTTNRTNNSAMNAG